MTAFPRKHSLLQKPLPLLYFLIVGLITYSCSITVPFYFDDFNNVLHPVLKIETISLSSLSSIFFESQSWTRPVSNLSFALNYYFCGENNHGYHLINILIHIFNGYVLFLILSKTLPLSFPDKKYNELTFLSLICALIWLVHPLATQSVTYIVQRMNCLATFFYLTSLLFYIFFRLDNQDERLIRYIYLIIFIICLTLSLGSKEIAVTLPFIILLYEWYFFQDLSIFWVKKFFICLIFFFIFVFIFTFIYTDGQPYKIIFEGYQRRDFSLYERLLTESVVIIKYISLLFFPLPSRLTFDYQFPISHNLFTPISTLFSLCTLILLFISSLLFSRKNKFFSFGILWFMITLSVESTFIPLELIYEHRTYLPSTFFLPSLITTAYLSINLIKLPYKKPLVFFVFCVCFFLLSIWTIQRNIIWNDPVKLWQSSLRNYPQNIRIMNNLGAYYLKNNEFKQAEPYLKNALKLNPEFPEALSNYALILKSNGNLQESKKLLQNAIKINPDYVEARLALASLEKVLGNIDEALFHYKYLHNLYPTFSEPNINIGQIYLNKGNNPEAIRFLLLAKPNTKEHITINLLLGQAYYNSGQTNKSITFFEETLSHDPNNVIANFYLSLLYTSIEKYNKAMFYYKKAYAVQPEIIPVAYNYGNFLLKQGLSEQAKFSYETFLKAEYIIADTHNNLGIIYANSNNFQKALYHFRMATLLNSNHEIAKKNILLIQDIMSGAETETQ